MRRTLPLLLAVGLSLLLAAPASAGLADRLVSDFADDGALDPCKYSQAEFGQIKDLIAKDTDAYSPDFRTVIEAVIEQRAQGACDQKKPQSGAANGGGGGGGTTATPGSTGGGSSGSPSPSRAGARPATPGAAAQAVPGPDQTPAPSPLITDSIAVAARSDDEGGAPPFPLLAIAVIAMALALGGLAFGTARWAGWEPAWADRARHCAAEAGWRASSTWAEFTDFVRFGR